MKEYVNCTILCILGFISSYCSFSQNISDPTKVNGVSAWWCADSIKQENGSLVFGWQSLTEEPMVLSQLLDENAPRLFKNEENLGFHNVLRFDGNDFLSGGDILNVGNGGQTAFVVGMSKNKMGTFWAKSTAGSGKYRYSLLYENNLRVICFTGQWFLINVNNNIEKYDLLSTKFDLKNADLQLFQDKNGLYTTNIDVYSKFNSRYDFLIGAYNNGEGSIPPNSSYYLNGDIAEIIFYDRPLSNLERQSVENYLRSKYFPGTEREQFSLGDDTVVSYGFKPIALTVPDRSYFQTITWSTGETSQSIQVNKPGEYSVFVTDDWGYEYVDTIQIVFPEINQISNQILCLGDTLKWDCGLAGDYTYVWSTGETSQAISITKAGTYSVTVTDNAGYSITSKPITITVDSFPKVATLGPDTLLCKGNIIQLQQGAEHAKSYEWFNGEYTPYCVVDAPGKYSVEVMDSNNCVARDTMVVAVHGVAPIVNFVAEKLCEGNITQILQNSHTTDNTEIVEHVWIMDADTLVGDVVSHQFPSWGAFPIQIRATNEEGCVGVLFDTIHIHPTPVASFSPLIACQYTEREITSTSKIADGEITTYSWEVDGNSFSEKSVQVLSDEIRMIPAKLTITSDQGCTATKKDEIQVVPSTKITLVHKDVCVGDTVLFFDATDYPVYNAMQDAYWLLDHTQKRSYSLLLPYITTDTTMHIVELYAKTFNGCMNIGRDTLRPYAIPEPRMDTLYTCVGSEIILKNSGVSRDNIASYVWNIVDSLTFTEEKPSFVLQRSGLFPVSLQVTTEAGCQAATTSAIVIDAQPQADFTFFPKKGAEPLFVNFTNESKHAVAYTWTFEQKEVETIEDPSYLFTDKETSYAKLVAHSVHDCRDSITKRIPLTLADEQLQITDVRTTIDANGFVSYAVQILNSGNVATSNIELLLSTPDIASLAESWNGTLEPGTVLDYVFAAKTKSINGTLPKYVCVTAEIVSPEEYKVYFSDNFCMDQTNEFSVYYVAPNPVDKEATVAFNTKRKGTVTVSCIDENGKVRVKREWENIEAGFHTIQIDTMELPSGRYVLVIAQDNQKQQIPFVK
ncbi:MAG: T9SS type A sorting domain-containing protein [Bacteroidales bacterium]|nr:T9SS type A sorting domain-containing protein [Bacteroidales bacterium]